MKRDIAVEEIRDARKRISARFGHRTKDIVRHYRTLEKKYRHRMVRAHPHGKVCAG